MLNLVSRLEAFRAEEQQLAWHGTFKEYFDLVIENPRIARLSHARVYDMLMAPGSETLPNGDKQHAFFSDDRPQVYQRAPAEDGWKRCVAFFTKHLKA